MVDKVHTLLSLPKIAIVAALLHKRNTVQAGCHGNCPAHHEVQGGVQQPYCAVKVLDSPCEESFVPSETVRRVSCCTLCVLYHHCHCSHHHLAAAVTDISV